MPSQNLKNWCAFLSYSLKFYKPVDTASYLAPGDILNVLKVNRVRTGVA